MFCSKCGNKMEDGAKFCNSCGSALVAEQLETNASATVSRKINKKLPVIITVCIVFIMVAVISVFAFNKKIDKVTKKMVIDFSKIKTEVAQELDHTDISEKIVIFGKLVNPTAENIARWIAVKIGDKCVRVSVEEAQGNEAVWSKAV